MGVAPAIDRGEGVEHARGRIRGSRHRKDSGVASRSSQSKPISIMIYMIGCRDSSGRNETRSENEIELFAIPIKNGGCALI